MQDTRGMLSTARYRVLRPDTVDSALPSALDA